MRLLTHNLLLCNRKQCSGGYPLKITLTDCPNNTHRDDAQNYNPDMVKKLLERISWDALNEAASSLSMALPVSYSNEDLNDDNFLMLVHDTLMNFHVLEGNLTCPVCHRIFPISKGIPNMLLHDEEV